MEESAFRKHVVGPPGEGEDDSCPEGQAVYHYPVTPGGPVWGEMSVTGRGLLKKRERVEEFDDAVRTFDRDEAFTFHCEDQALEKVLADLGKVVYPGTDKARAFIIIGNQDPEACLGSPSLGVIAVKGRYWIRLSGSLSLPPYDKDGSSCYGKKADSFEECCRRYLAGMTTPAHLRAARREAEKLVRLFALAPE
jgi:hypothetical protein